MRETEDHFRLLGDASRIRILMLLSRRELCVCQIMGVLGMSQPLVSRNLSLLFKAGYLADRREGKMMFYSLGKKLPEPHRTLIRLLQKELRKTEQFKRDLTSLEECTEYQKASGKCDMKTFLAYMKRNKRGTVR
ncbi:MAG TPA: metalloregulator ArsR/SmtB family transcription factor [Dissulfurispiraceae bacterium]|nr:metalloregulator ArsR/SmtB family transcription factor [Dissulfurispiraceae bacterium]